MKTHLICCEYLTQTCELLYFQIFDLLYIQKMRDIVLKIDIYDMTKVKIFDLLYIQKMHDIVLKMDIYDMAEMKIFDLLYIQKMIDI